MNRPTQYKIVKDISIPDLTDRVNAEIKVGWIPQGSAFVWGDWVCQALCAYDLLGPYISRRMENAITTLDVDIREGNLNG